MPLMYSVVEDRLTLVMQPATSGYYLKSQTLTRINSSLFTLAFKSLTINQKSELTLEVVLILEHHCMEIELLLPIKLVILQAVPS